MRLRRLRQPSCLRHQRHQRYCLLFYQRQLRKMPPLPLQLFPLLLALFNYLVRLFLVLLPRLRHPPPRRRRQRLYPIRRPRPRPPLPLPLPHLYLLYLLVTSFSFKCSACTISVALRHTYSPYSIPRHGHRKRYRQLVTVVMRRQRRRWMTRVRDVEKQRALPSAMVTLLERRTMGRPSRGICARTYARGSCLPWPYNPLYSHRRCWRRHLLLLPTPSG